MNGMPHGGSLHHGRMPDPWRDRSFETSEPCPVCGQPLRPGRGWVIHYAGRWVRLRCGDCAATFETDPRRYAAGPPRV